MKDNVMTWLYKWMHGREREKQRQAELEAKMRLALHGLDNLTQQSRSKRTQADSVDELVERVIRAQSEGIAAMGHGEG